jgi:hypothetical protein
VSVGYEVRQLGTPTVTMRTHVYTPAARGGMVIALALFQRTL